MSHKVHTKIIITGAPGTGKTSIIEDLKLRGHVCYDEVARSVIKQEMGISDCLPWDNVLAFSIKVINQTQKHLEDSKKQKLSFFDRGLPDTVAYLRLAGIDDDLGIEENLKEIAYFPAIFLTPFWEEIYAKDQERKESIEEAMAIEKSLIETYESMGFSIVKIKQGTVEERSQFVLNYLKEQDVLV